MNTQSMSVRKNVRQHDIVNLAINVFDNMHGTVRDAALICHVNKIPINVALRVLTQDKRFRRGAQSTQQQHA